MITIYLLLTFYVNLILKSVKKSLKIFIISKVIPNFKKLLIFAFMWMVKNKFPATFAQQCIFYNICYNKW